MAMPEYHLSCPHCGALLEPYVGTPESAPWLCQNCRRGWFAAELTPEARKAWRPLEKDHHGLDHDAFMQIDLDRHLEIDEARKRNTSARHDHLALLRADQMVTLLRFADGHDHPAAQKLVAAAKTVTPQMG
jgi:hypothetical protein